MQNVVVVVQARISSHRLPAKALLCINGRSLIDILAARLLSKKYDLVFAFPEGNEGAVLAEEMLPHQSRVSIKFGSLHDVLDRFVTAVENYKADDIVIRLTADNILTDYRFIEELISKYKGGYSYAAINDAVYGLSAEIFQKKHLLEAASQAETALEKEHVTPYIRKKYLKAPIVHDVMINRQLRMTVDNYQDFLNLRKLFSHFKDPVHTSWIELAEKAVELFPEKKKMMLGTAQFGMHYGITNTGGTISNEEISNIIQLANDHSVLAYDTAADYGHSETILGENAPLLANAHITSKLKCGVRGKEAIKHSVLESLWKLKRDRLDGLLFHSFNDYQESEGLENIQHLADKVGVSVYTPEEARVVADDRHSDIIQIPYNILDWRWERFIEEYGNTIKIYVRSVFLQGAILSNSLLSDRGYAELNAKLDYLVEKLNRKNRADLAIAYVRSQPWVDYTIIGIDNMVQAQENILLFDTPTLGHDEIQEVKAQFLDTDLNLLDIRKW